MQPKKLPKLPNDQEYLSFVFAVLKAIGKPETELEYQKQTSLGLDFEGLYNGRIKYRNIPNKSGLFFRGCSGRFYTSAEVLAEE